MSSVEETISAKELRRFVRNDIRSAEFVEADVRFLVDFFYQRQDDRIRAGHQLREPGGESRTVVEAAFEVSKAVEEEIKYALDRWSDKYVAGRWSKSILGVGPVLSAGLLAHVDLEHTTNPSKLWSFAGLNPEQKWEKGKKRPWNARLKVLCWKLGDSFTKQSFRIMDEDGDFNERAYGDGLYCRLLVEHKRQEVAKNEAGAFEETAREALESRTWKDKTSPTYQAYTQGKLPDGRIHLRAQRKAVKIYLSHWWAVRYQERTGLVPPDPWIHAFGGHSTRIPIPNFPF